MYDHNVGQSQPGMQDEDLRPNSEAGSEQQPSQSPCSSDPANAAPAAAQSGVAVGGA